MKLYGWLIEWTESQRDKLKQKPKFDQWLGFTQRVIDLRIQVMSEYLSMPRYGIEHLLEESRMCSPVTKMIEIYKSLRQQLCKFFAEEGSVLHDLPTIKLPIDNSMSKLSELNVCLGQLLSIALAKLYECL